MQLYYITPAFITNVSHILLKVYTAEGSVRDKN